MINDRCKNWIFISIFWIAYINAFSPIGNIDRCHKYYIFYYYEGKQKLLKKDSEGQLMSSLDRLKNKGIDAYLAVDLFSLEFISYNYKELSIEESLREPYMIIVKTERLS